MGVGEEAVLGGGRVVEEGTQEGEQVEEEARGKGAEGGVRRVGAGTQEGEEVREEGRVVTESMGDRLGGGCEREQEPEK